MKKIEILAVVALLMMFGCSKDNLIDIEQDSIIVEENKHFENGDIGSRRGDGGINGWNFVEFYGTSTGTESLTICLPDSFGLPGMDCGRKLLKNGNFSGNLPGYGKINSSLSPYTVKFREPQWEEWPLYQNAEHYALYSDPILTARFEKYFYNIEIIGTVATSAKDSFKFKIIGVLRPMVPDTSGTIIKGSWFFGLMMEISEGKGKFENYTQTFYNCSTTQISGTNFSGVNLETGEMSLFVNNIHF